MEGNWMVVYKDTFTAKVGRFLRKIFVRKKKYLIIHQTKIDIADDNQVQLENNNEINIESSNIKEANGVINNM